METGETDAVFIAKQQFHTIGVTIVGHVGMILPLTYLVSDDNRVVHVVVAPGDSGDANFLHKVSCVAQLRLIQIFRGGVASG